MNKMVPAHTIGGYVPLVDGPEKVSGRAKYTADLIVPGMLAGRTFCSPYSHAEILQVDVSEATKLPGVKAIVTGADCERLRRASDRAHRTPAGAQPGALPRRADRRRCGNRRCDRQGSAAAHQGEGPRTTGLSHGARGDGAGCRRAAQTSAEKHRARRDATGLRFNDLPVTPDRVFAAIEKRARGRKTSGGA